MGNEVILSKKHPRIITKNNKVIKLKRKGGMFILEMWYKVLVQTGAEKTSTEGPDGKNIKGDKKPGFTRQGR